MLAALLLGAAGDPTTSVAAAFSPLAEAAAQVGGRHVDVTSLTPPGVEPHDLELTTDDVDAILDADLAIVLGDGFQPAVESSADDREGPTLVVLDDIRHSRRRDDPHVWLDPVRYASDRRRSRRRSGQGRPRARVCLPSERRAVRCAPRGARRRAPPRARELRVAHDRHRPRCVRLARRPLRPPSARDRGRRSRS